MPLKTNGNEQAIPAGIAEPPECSVYLHDINGAVKVAGEREHFAAEERGERAHERGGQKKGQRGLYFGCYSRRNTGSVKARSRAPI